MNVNRLIAPCKPPACSNSTIHPNTIIIITNIECLQVLSPKLNQKNITQPYPSKFSNLINTPNINCHDLTTPCKPPVYSNITIHPI